MSLERLADKNIDRAAGLVVRIQRAIERNIKAAFEVGNKMQEEQARHLRAMDDLRMEEKDIAATGAELEKELADAKEYLKALTVEKSKA